MAEFTIAWLDAQPPEEVEYAQSLLPDGIGITAAAGSGRGELESVVKEADAIMTQRVPVDRELIAQAGRLKLIQKYGRREDGIDLEAARQAGVVVAVMPLRGCIAVAELAITLVMALSKNLLKAHQYTSEGAYRELGLEPKVTSQREIAFQWMALPMMEVYGTTLGIIGYGEIGTEASIRARAFGMDVLYNKHTRLPEDVERRLEVGWAERDELLQRSDFVLLSAPHTPETEKMIGARELALMKPSAYLVNIARGGLVDEAALVAALREGRIAGAGLDVFVEEPVPADNPLLGLENVILTPHIGGGTGGTRFKQMSDVLGNIVRFASGEAPEHQC